MTPELINPDDLPTSATYTHGAKPTIFVVDYRREQLPTIAEAGAALFGDHKPPDTLLGVEALSRPEFLIEVEAIAVVDA